MILIKNSFYTDMVIWLVFLQNASWDQETPCAVVSVAFSFALARSSRGLLFAPFLSWNLGENVVKISPLPMVHGFFLLMWCSPGSSQILLSRSVPTSKGRNKIPPQPHVLNCSWNSCCHFLYSCFHVEDALLKALLEIKHEIELPVEGNACRRDCKAKETTYELSSKGSSFLMTEDLWPVEDCSRQAGGSGSRKGVVYISMHPQRL